MRLGEILLQAPGDRAGAARADGQPIQADHRQRLHQRARQEYLVSLLHHRHGTGHLLHRPASAGGQFRTTAPW